MTFEQKLRQAEKYLKTSDKKLALLITGQCDLKPHTNYYSTLVRSIVGQQLSVKAAAAIWKRITELFDDKIPTPEQLIKIDREKLRQTGLSYPKVNYIKDLAEHIIDKRLDLAHISTMPNDQLIEQLTAVKGIGEWSAHMFMIFSLGRLDILPVGDLGIRKAVQQIYGLKDLPDPARVVTIATKHKWHPYESVVSWYLWQKLDNAPS